MLALFLGGITALLNYLGGSTLYLIIRLSLQGTFMASKNVSKPHQLVPRSLINSEQRSQ